MKVLFFVAALMCILGTCYLQQHPYPKSCNEDVYYPCYYDVQSNQWLWDTSYAYEVEDTSKASPEVLARIRKGTALFYRTPRCQEPTQEPSRDFFTHKPIGDE